LTDATTDQGRIRKWWSRWPDANIGILTGAESGLVVVDVDNKSGKKGSDNLAALAALHGGLPETLTATTGNGEHLFFKHPGVAVKNAVSKIADGVDVRADRGYVVAAPSLHANGKRYTWKNADQSPADLPDWLLEMLRENKEITNRMQNEERMETEEHAPSTEDSNIYQGERNQKLFTLGCSLRGQLAMQDGEIVDRLLLYNMAKCIPPLDEKEVLLIAASVCKHPPESGTKKSGAKQEQNPLYWFKFNVRDFSADQNIQVMTDQQLGWCIRLRVSAWQNAGFLPLDIDRLWRLARATSKGNFKKHAELVLSEYAQVTIAEEEKLMHRQLAPIYADTLEEWLKKRAAGIASATARQKEMAVLAAAEQRTAIVQ
jgi:hypothetical protein